MSGKERWRGKSALDGRSGDIEDIRKGHGTPETDCEAPNRAARRLLAAATPKPVPRKPGEFTNTLEADEWLEKERIRQKHKAKRDEADLASWGTPQLTSSVVYGKMIASVLDQMTVASVAFGQSLLHEPEETVKVALHTNPVEVSNGALTFSESSGVIDLSA